MLNLLRDGIRPYIEVWQGDHKVLCSLQDYDSMKLYMAHDNKVCKKLIMSTDHTISLKINYFIDSIVLF